MNSSSDFSPFLTNRTGGLPVPVDPSWSTERRGPISPVHSASTSSSTTSSPRAANPTTPRRLHLHSPIRRSTGPKTVRNVTQGLATAPLYSTQPQQQNVSPLQLNDAMSGESGQLSPVSAHSTPRFFALDTGMAGLFRHIEQGAPAHSAIPHNVDSNASTPPINVRAIQHRQIFPRGNESPEPVRGAATAFESPVSGSPSEVEDIAPQPDRLRAYISQTLADVADQRKPTPSPRRENPSSASGVETQTPSSTDAVTSTTAPASGASVLPAMDHRDFINWARLAERTRAMAASISESLHCPWICCMGPGEDN